MSTAEEVIAREANRILRRGRIEFPPMPRDARRRLMQAEKEIRQDWRAGKSIQRKQNLGIVPLAWAELYGLNLTQTPPPHPRDLVLPPTRGHEAFTLLVAQQVVTTVPSSHLDDTILNTIHSSLYPIWTYMKARELGAPNVFSVRDSLVEKLLNTDIDNVRPDDVHLPFPGFYLSLPFGEKSMFLRNPSTGFHEVSLVGVAEGRFNNERSIVCTFWGEPRKDGHGPSDDHIYSFSFPLPSGETDQRSLPSLLLAGDEEQRVYMRDAGLPLHVEKDMAQFYDESYDFYDAVALMRRLVINFCLYLSSPNLDIEPTKSGQSPYSLTVRGEAEPKRTKVRVSKRRRASKKKPPKYAPYSVWDVGRNVERLRVSTATDILVRGHFRKQAHGPRSTLRKIIWIEPHIRLATEGESPGHEYAVTENR